MTPIDLTPGLVTVGLFTVAALFIAWASHRPNDRRDPKRPAARSTPKPRRR